jgi:hypothetical protein
MQSWTCSSDANRLGVATVLIHSTMAPRHLVRRSLMSGRKQLAVANIYTYRRLYPSMRTLLSRHLFKALIAVASKP